jgi:hypothetical protein
LRVAYCFVLPSSARGGHFSKGLEGYNIGNVQQFQKNERIREEQSKPEHVEIEAESGYMLRWTYAHCVVKSAQSPVLFKFLNIPVYNFFVRAYGSIHVS